MTSVVVKSVDTASVRRAMDEYAGRLLASRPEVEEVIVFGSFASGTYAPGSDILFPFTRQEMAARQGSPLLEEVRRSTWRYSRSPSAGRAG